ncbi:MAG: hypothetical protein GY928_21295 [Colwellia sp.]|nr:hypothetical protein [Colwellia sp.]
MKQLVLDEKAYSDTINYLQELPHKMSNNLIVQLVKLYNEQNPEQPKQEVVD